MVLFLNCFLSFCEAPQASSGRARYINALLLLLLIIIMIKMKNKVSNCLFVFFFYQGVWSTPKANEKKLNASFKVRLLHLHQWNLETCSSGG